MIYLEKKKKKRDSKEKTYEIITKTESRNLKL